LHNRDPAFGELRLDARETDKFTEETLNVQLNFFTFRTKPQARAD
jgi:hypothetical protein